MFESYNICPYTGLRPFSEEESLYFKGRDEHIEQATRQLEKNKFLIMTGASGDGKSSLIFAGVIPNARAGFLKSRYSNWSVADFRPERTPYKNLCISIASALGIPDPLTVEAALRHGFSALTDIYKASPLYFEENESSGSLTHNEGKAATKRKAANLIILCDQFEEFFTNPENYQNGIPSQEANLVVNLLLETARLALEEGLPIYVVITMRSDFIGQCAAFRGLPEYIGFSQFFVPRLNRKQLQEVIEEPAMLSGNKISRRLTERLIQDITEGADQLPILQHALNQIWKVGDEGREEMDLIHYAMVGGLDPQDLPGGDVERFQQWFAALPSKIRECYDKPGLQNVLNTHANKLLNLSADYVKEHFGYAPTAAEAHLVIKTTFKCLTKINQGRAVRNRMTLGEITKVLDMPGMTAARVNHILTIFRAFSNALLKPYIPEDDPGLVELSDGAILDITHESLIRNWSYLKEWAAEEFDNFTIFQDFHQQLNRWVESEKSGDFLLSMGQLTYFENWLSEAKPNEHWIGRYYAGDDGHALQEKSPAEILRNTRELIQRSNRKHIVTRTVMRYGPRRIVTVLALLVLLTTSSFLLNNYLNRTEQAMRQRLKREMFGYHNNDKVYLIEKIAPYAEQLRFGEVTVKETWNKIEDPDERVNLTTAVLSFLITTAMRSDEPEITSGFHLIDSVLNQRVNNLEDADLNFLIHESADLMAILDMSCYFQTTDPVRTFADENAKRIGKIVRHVLENKPESFRETTYLNANIEYALNHRAWSRNEILELLKLFSPFEISEDNRQWIASRYSFDEVYTTGWNANTHIKFNGLYQQVAYLYASVGDVSNTLRCVDSLLAHGEGYLSQRYLDHPDNAFNIALYFARYGHDNELDQFVADYCRREAISSPEFYERLLSRALVYHVTNSKLGLMGFARSSQQHNSNVDLSSPDELHYLFGKYRASLIASRLSQSEEQFKLAMSYKNEGALLAKRLEDGGKSWKSDPAVAELYSKAYETYERVPAEYLEEIVTAIGAFAPIPMNVPRGSLFLWPDFKVPFRPYRDAPFLNYVSFSFIEYLMDQDLFQKLYSDEEGIEQVQEWFSAYVSSMASNVVVKATNIPYPMLQRIENAVNRAGAKANFSMLYLTLGRVAFLQGDTAGVVGYYNQADVERLIDFIANIDFLDNNYLRMVAFAMSDMAATGKMEKALSFPKSFDNPVNRSSLYAFAAMELIRWKGAIPEADRFIDSSYVELSRVKSGDSQAHKISLAGALAYRNKPGDVENAVKVIKNVPFKELGLWMIARGLARNGELYRAYSMIPTNISDDNFSGYFFEMYYDYKRDLTTKSPFWYAYETDRFVQNDHIQYQY